MLLLGYDIEATGLDVEQDRIIELGVVLWDTDTNTPIALQNDLVKDRPDLELTPEIVELTGITQLALDRHGIPLQTALRQLNALADVYKPEMVVAHNGRGYDFPMLRNEFTRAGLESPLFGLETLDTVEDIPFPIRIKNRGLVALAAEHGFLNPFPHRAVFDVLTMFKVLSCYSLPHVLSYAREPWVYVKAVVSYDQRGLAKSRRYSWEQVAGQTYPKTWVKRLKLSEVAKEEAEAPFRVVVL